MGLPVYMVEGNYRNIKITTQEDLGHCPGSFKGLKTGLKIGPESLSKVLKKHKKVLTYFDRHDTIIELLMKSKKIRKKQEK